MFSISISTINGTLLISTAALSLFVLYKTSQNLATQACKVLNIMSVSSNEKKYLGWLTWVLKIPTLLLDVYFLTRKLATRRIYVPKMILIPNGTLLILCGLNR